MVNRLRRALVLGAGGAIGGSMLAPALAAGARAAPAVGEEVALLSTYVAGTAYHGAAERVSRLRPGDALELRRAPGHRYDARAIEVRTGDGGALLGYVPRMDNQALANLMDAGFRPTARVRAVVPDAARPEIRLDIALVMGV